MGIAISVRFAILCVFATPFVVADEPVDFARDVVPVYEQHCVRCHSSLSNKGDLSLETFSDLKTNEYVVAGNPDASHLIDVVSSSPGNTARMPKDGRPLSTDQIHTLRRWIEGGANWPSEFVIREKSKADSSWWSLQPLPRQWPVSVDAGVTGAGNAETEPSSTLAIDTFVRSSLAAKGLSAAPRADRQALIRRVYFDLTGLPPAPEVLDTFEGDDDPKAYENLVDQLLASPHFGERWARHWLDIAHYADTHGFERDKRRDNAWRYRDYVIQSFNADKPYDQFLREQIAGDVLAPDDADSVIATGFLAAGPWDFVGQVETQSPVLRRSARALDLDDMVTQVMTSTVGMTVNCARCHNHKLDPILQREYYQLTAVFAGLKRGDRDVSTLAQKNYETTKTRLHKAISGIVFRIGQLQGRGIDLADIVGGGTGFGAGKKGLGIDARTGKMQERSFGDLADVRPGEFHACDYEFIDGVFVPAGGRTQISSSKMFAEELPTNSGKAWDMIRNGPVASQFSTRLGVTDFNTNGHSLLGLHANAGITFSLSAIRDRQRSVDDAKSPTGVFLFSTVVGYGGQPEVPSAEYRVLLDGHLKAHRAIGRNDADHVEFEVPLSAQFLTFISTDGGNGYSHDQISFGDATLFPTHSSEKSSEVELQLVELKMQKQTLEEELATLGDPPVFFGVISEIPPEIKILVRGDPESSTGGPVPPGTLGWKKAERVFGDTNTSESSRRVALAGWITDSQNPLTARVIVNRLWHWHFGRGIVGTPSDFGYGGEAPSHPELLDWLAAELIQSGWSLKHIHRLIVNSEAYRRSSTASNAPESVSAADIDSDNRMLWRMNPRRLEAEAVRDAVLAISGKLNSDMFGPGYQDFDYEEAYAPIYSYKTADSPELWRRSIYRFIVRTTPQQFLAALDCADPANFTPKRNVTTTALQSLALLNNDFMLRQSQYFAERLEREARTVDQQIELAFRLAFSRPVTKDELTAARQLVSTQGLMHLCRVLFNANEFVYVD